MTDWNPDMPGGFIRVARHDQETFIRVADIDAIETVGVKAKPAGWFTGTAAAVYMRGGKCVALNYDEWDLVKSLLSIHQGDIWKPEVHQ